MTGINIANPSPAKFGGKIALSDDRRKFEMTPSLVVPFHPKNFDGKGGPPQSLVARMTPELEAQFAKFDEDTRVYLQLHSGRLFGRSLTAAEVQDMYNPIVKQKDGMDPVVKFKLTDRTQWWKPGAIRGQMPDDLKGYVVRVSYCLNHMWFKNQAMGWCLRADDIELQDPAAPICPFA